MRQITERDVYREKIIKVCYFKIKNGSVENLSN
jgi:hypothetical protein